MENMAAIRARTVVAVVIMMGLTLSRAASTTTSSTGLLWFSM